MQAAAVNRLVRRPRSDRRPAPAVIRQRRVAIGTLDHFVTTGAINEIGITPPVEQQNRLMLLGNGLPQQVLHPQADQVHPLAHLCLGPQINQLHRRHRQSAHAAGQG